MPAASRGCGYCLTQGCEDYGNAIFSLAGSNLKPWPCRACHNLVHFVPEIGWSLGDSRIFREVRVEFRWSALIRGYRGLAIVRAEHPDFWGGSVWYQQSPLLSTESQALKTAERILGNLNQHGRAADARETVIDFDDREYRTRLAELGRLLQGRGGDPG